MKSKSLLVLGLVTFSSLMISCSSEDDALETTSKIETEYVTFGSTITTDGAQNTNTRIGLYDESDQGTIKCVWSEGDKIKVNGNEFQLLAGAGNTSALFGGEVQKTRAVVNKFVAFYNSDEAEGEALNLDYSTQDGTLEYCQRNSGMFATATENNPNLAFRQVSTILRINVNLGREAANKIIEKVELQAYGLINKNTYSYSDQTGSASWGEGEQGNIVLNLKNNKTDALGHLVVYMMVFPQTLQKGLTLKATVGLDGYTYVKGSNKVITFKEGKAHIINKNYDPWTPGLNPGFDGEYYMWDAKTKYIPGKDSNWYTKENLGTAWYNETYNSAVWPHEYDKPSFNPTNSAKGCPTFLQTCSYIDAGIYYGDAPKGYNYVDVKGEVFNKGLWLKKSKYIENFGKESDKSSAYKFGQTRTPGDWSTVPEEEKSQYFFLPTTGHYWPGWYEDKVCYYWTSTPHTNNSNSFVLVYTHGVVAIYSMPRTTASYIWSVN